MPLNIVLIVIDALRARNLGCYGGNETSSPHIDGLAAQGVQFDHCFACWNTTDQSLTSIFSGKYPRTHGIMHHGDKVTAFDRENFQRLDTSMLAEILKRSGYATGAVDWMGRWFKRGFDEYGYSWPRSLPARLYYVLWTLPYVHLRYMAANVGYLRLYAKRHKRKTGSLWKSLKGVLSTFRFTFELARVQDADFVTRLAEKRICRLKNDPFFLFLHYWDTHTPYNCPRNYSPASGKARGPEQVFSAKYEGAVRYVDEQIGRLRDLLEKQGLLDDTLIIITSDHGESLTEHDIFFDHHGLYDVTTHVPLILFHPKLFPSPRKIDSLIQHVDLVPSLCDLLEIDPQPFAFDGKSFTPLLKQKESPMREYIFAEESYVQRKVAIRNLRHKFIFAPDGKGVCSYCLKVHGGAEELYDLQADPEETDNRADRQPVEAAALKREAVAFMQALQEKKHRILAGAEGISLEDSGKPDEKEQKKIRRKLKSMGYMD
jgi:arylsulfatase A-like enzyme